MFGLFFGLFIMALATAGMFAWQVFLIQKT
jgi:hypothetical protein